MEETTESGRRGKRNVVVLGGGISGLAAALALADAGLNVYLVEKEAAVGGQAASFCCKATQVCALCSACVVRDKVAQVVTHPLITLFTNSTIKEVSGRLGDFFVKMVEQPSYIDPDRCTACGLCYEACPAEPKAVSRPAAETTPPVYVLEQSLCLQFKGEKCDLCARACPSDAIAFKVQSRERELLVDAVIVATGFDVFDAKEKGSLGYGRYPNVFTGLDLERMLSREGRLKLATEDKKALNIAFIQCVGSRNTEHGYCSQVCCKYAMKTAGLIKYQNPDAKVTIFYIDLQTAGKGFAQFYQQYKEDIRFVQGVPVEVLQTTSGELEVRFEDILRGKVSHETFDIVVLSVGISPRKDSWDLAKTLGISLSGHGFLRTRDSFNSNETDVDGIFLAGTCQGPKDIPSSIAHGMAAAAKVVEALERLENQSRG